MPIYLYKCRKCRSEAEYIQRMSDAAKTKCEECGGRLDKQITSAAFHLKGGGWYSDGYGSTGASAEGAESSSASKAGKSDTSASSKKAASDDD